MGGGGGGADLLTDDTVAGMLPDLRAYALYLTRNDTDADDLIGSTMLQAIETIRKEDQYIYHPQAWLKRMMRYIFFRQFHRKKKVDANSCELIENMAPSINPEQETIYTLKELGRLISSKGFRDREIIQSHVSGYQVSEISNKYKGYRTSKGTIRRVISDFKAEVKEMCV